ncbi:MAG: phosphoribosylamine--glycine ligase [Legionellales bacterium]|nr:phosphoribosylamine--glycine ligase [Legionellales bacterium]
MNILIIGQGGREHALAFTVAKSPYVQRIFVAPGNAGCELENKVSNINIPVENIPALIQFAQSHAIDLTIVGPEAPLCAGIVDDFQAHHLACFGPSRLAARLEGSKVFSKEFMLRHHIPTARFGSFDNIAAAEKFIQEHNVPLVLKVDGLAAGKGVVIAHTKQEAYNTLDNMFNEQPFGDAGTKIIIEEFLRGQEVSFMVVSDGRFVCPLATAQDHKTIFDDDKGANTGGMGAYSPAPMITAALQQEIMETIVYPTIRGMQAEGNPYIGILYCGLMIDETQGPVVLEYNCRFGDPEAQVILPRLKSDFVALCQAALQGELNNHTLTWDPNSCLGVVLAAKGYPGDYTKGQVISGWQQPLHNGKIFHAATQLVDQQLVSNGGRVLCVSGFGETLAQAKTATYSLLNYLNAEAFHYRRDIGDKGI